MIKVTVLTIVWLEVRVGETRTEGFEPWPGRLFGPYLEIFRAIKSHL